MAQGLQIWDASGNLVVDITTRLSRLVGILTLPGGSSGSVDLSAYGGTPWYRASWTGFNTIGLGLYPSVTITGSVINWNNSMNTDPSTLIYGVY